MLLAELKQGRGDADYSSIAQKYFPASKMTKLNEQASTEQKRPAWALPAESKPATPPLAPEPAKTAEPPPGKGAEPAPAKTPAPAQSPSGILRWFGRRS
jgi:cell division protein FtsN